MVSALTAQLLESEEVGVRELSWEWALALPPRTSQAAAVPGTARSPEVRGWAMSAHFPKNSATSAISYSRAELIGACALRATGLGLLRVLATALLLRWAKHD
jgi:hypothetical protein